MHLQYCHFSLVFMYLLMFMPLCDDATNAYVFVIVDAIVVDDAIIVVDAIFVDDVILLLM